MKVKELTTVVLFIVLLASNSFAQDSLKKEIGLIDAVTISLKNNHDVRLKEEQIKSSKAKIQAADGAFDSQLLLSTSHNHTESEQDNETTIISMGVSKKLRSGITIDPSLTTTYSNPESSIESVSNSSLNLIINIPLLKGFGKKVVTASENGAKIGYDISLLNMHYSLSDTIKRTVSSYWNYLAAGKILQFLKQSEERARTTVEDTKLFIEAKNKPESDLEQAIANFAEKTATMISGEHNLFEAKQNLGLSMGILFEEHENQTLSSEKFPDINQKQIMEISLNMPEIINESLKLRPDYLALIEQQKLRSINLAVAKDNLKQQLDLSLNVGYTGTSLGKPLNEAFHSLTENNYGPSCGITLTYLWPFTNNTAKGQYRQQTSSYTQSILTAKKAAQQIRSTIMVAVSRIKTSALQLEKSRKSVKFYEKAVANEKLKYKAGISTILDIINTEDRLTNIQLAEISAMRNYMTAVIEFRHQTGTIVDASTDNLTVKPETLISLPTVNH